MSALNRQAAGGSFVLVLAAAMMLAEPGQSADPRPARLTPKSKVSTQGLGPVRIGMTKSAAEHAARAPMRYSGPALDGCRYMRPADARIRASFMLHRGRVVRVDIGRRGIATPSGERVATARARCVAGSPDGCASADTSTPMAITSSSCQRITRKESDA